MEVRQALIKGSGFRVKGGNLKHIHSVLIIFILLFSAAGLSVHAQEVGPEQTSDESALVLGDGPSAEDSPAVTPLSGFGVWDFLRMILVLAVVVGLIYGVFHFIKKAGSPRDDGVRFIRVLETRPLAGNRHLHLVEVGNQIMLVGSSENGVRLVSQLEDKETLDGIRLQASRISPRPKNFTDTLKMFLGKGAGGASAPAGGEGGQADPGSLDFILKQKERLKKLF
ncbi:MAG: flagellar biosynthetic protein FliO [Spirochaetales bacterium]|nr:flagellar biosynthetic protein FliO [Spirochaetales bacterium]